MSLPHATPISVLGATFIPDGQVTGTEFIDNDEAGTPMFTVAADCIRFAPPDRPNPRSISYQAPCLRPPDR